MPEQNIPPTETKKKPRTHDWERIELEFRAGLLSLREIAATHGVSHVAISKRARRDGWEKDLSPKINAKADALVNKAEVTKSENSEQLVTEKLLVDSSAQVIAGVRIGHRRDIARARRLAVKLLEELEEQTDNLGLIERLETAMANAKINATGLAQAFQKVTSTGARIDNMKKLAEAMRVLVSMEREAYNIVELTKVDHTSSDGSMTPSKPMGRTLDDFYADHAKKAVG
ncbi:MAG: hypothetical protein [Bacteriophage sp.]|nr:MAG: hypothetical protein [Bacteriophage sp.]